MCNDGVLQQKSAPATCVSAVYVGKRKLCGRGENVVINVTTTTNNNNNNNKKNPLNKGMYVGHVGSGIQ